MSHGAFMPFQNMEVTLILVIPQIDRAMSTTRRDCFPIRIDSHRRNCGVLVGEIRFRLDFYRKTGGLGFRNIRKFLYGRIRTWNVLWLLRL